jgi:hypothetical protein
MVPERPEISPAFRFCDRGNVATAAGETWSRSVATWSQAECRQRRFIPSDALPFKHRTKIFVYFAHNAMASLKTVFA